MSMQPPWLYDLGAAVMLAVSAHAAARLGSRPWTGPHLREDLEVSHLAMGIAMAGMFVRRLAFGPPAVWEAVFAALALWFAARVVVSLLAGRPGGPHLAVHAAMAAAMLLMYGFPATTRTVDGALPRAPGLAAGLAVLFLVSAALTLASPAGPGGERGDRGRGGTLRRAVGSARVANVAHAAMAVSMGFMLLVVL